MATSTGPYLPAFYCISTDPYGEWGFMQTRHHSGPFDLIAVSGQLLELADQGMPRAQFLKEALHILIEFTLCDNIKLVIMEKGRRFRCEATRDPGRPFRFEETPQVQDRETGIMWSSGHSDSLEQTCRDIIEKIFDPTSPWFTRHGSLWTGDVRTLPLSGLSRPNSDNDLGIAVDPEIRSLALMAIDAVGGCIGLLALESRQENLFSAADMESLECLTHTLGIAFDHRQLRLALRERVKELTCLYGIVRLVARPKLSLAEILQQAVELLPAAWLYPEVTAARVVLGDHCYATAAFRKPVQSLTADIVIHGAKRGWIEVGYTWAKPPIDEGPFLSEERSLIDTVARELSFIIQRRMDEEERNRLQEQLRHADRLATIGQMAAGVAHEINEPLANILGFAQLAEKDATLSDQSRHDIGKIISATLHLRDVIRNLLVFARQTAPKKSRFDLNRLIHNGLQFFERRCVKGGIELTYHPAPDLPAIHADAAQLLQVLTNLVVNAIQAMPNGGSLTVDTAADDGTVVLTVADSGVGMTESTLERIFDPFFTTKDVNQGTGLGMSVVHGIVISHGGTIDVSSRVGAGSTVTVRLPLNSPPDEEGTRPHG